MSRACDAIGCNTPTASGRFMCLKHWPLVPIEQQRTINDRHRKLRKDYAFLSDVAYLEACVNAIDDIATREGKADVNPYSWLLRLAKRRAGAA